MDLRMFTNDTDTVIAKDVDDAWVVWSEHTGEDREDYDDPYGWSWKEMPGTEELSIWCDSAGDPDTPESDGVELMAKTVAEWIAAQGRGFLCSTEY